MTCLNLLHRFRVPSAALVTLAFGLTLMFVAVPALAQGPDQLGHVDARTSVDRRGVLLAEDVDSHENSP